MDWLGVKEFIKDSFIYIILCILVILFVVYVVSFGQVIGPSMNNTLNNGNIILVSKLHSKILTIKRNDIIAFDYSGNKFLIKRVIGIENDIISFKDNKLYINDKLVEEDYIIPIEIKDKTYDVVPKDSYFVMGDNRGDSLDSRNFGFIKKSDIIGKVIFRIFPFDKIGIVK